MSAQRGGASPSVSDLVARFGREVGAKVQGPAGANSGREDSLTAPVEQLLRDMAKRQHLKLVAHGQSRIEQLKVRPDFAISTSGRTIGHVELKKPGKGVDPQSVSEICRVGCWGGSLGGV